MIEVIFLGVGEAFDEALPNTSILLKFDQGASRVNLLLDCGPMAPPEFWKLKTPADSLDAIALFCAAVNGDDDAVYSDIVCGYCKWKRHLGTERL